MQPLSPSWRRALRAALLIAATSLSAPWASAAALTRQAVASDVPASLAGVEPAGTPANAKPMTVDIALPLGDEAGAIRFADSVSNPASPLYGQYLKPAQFAARFGASAADYAAVASWARAQGLAVRPPNAAHTLVSVVGTISQIEQAFAVKFAYYKDRTGRVFASATAAPSLPSAISGRVDAVIGLSRRVGKAPDFVRAPAKTARPFTAGGTGPGGAYAPADFIAAYQTPAPAIGGPAETLAVFEQGGYYSSDIAKFVASNKLPTPSVTNRYVDDYGGGVDDPDVELESVLDIETILGATRGTAGVLVYEDGEDFNIALLDSLTAMADDDKANIISISYGGDEAYAGAKALKAERRALLQLTAQGQTVLASAGDSGAMAMPVSG